MKIYNSRGITIAALAVALTSAFTAGSALAEEPDTVASALERAATLLQEDRPRAALEALQPVEQHEPLNPWLGLYRGLAHLRLGNAYLALDSFDGALKELDELGNPDPPLADTLRLYRRQARRQTLTFSFQSGLAYDTNVSFLGDTAGTLGLVSGRRDTKFASDFRLSYAPLATERNTLAVGARLAHIWHFAVTEFDYQDYGGLVRFAHRFDRNWEAGIQYDYDITLLDRDSFLSNHALTPSLSYRWPIPAGPVRLDRTTAYYQFSAQDFLYPSEPAFDRDGFINAVGMEQSFAFRTLPNAVRESDLTLGYRFASVTTEGDEFDRNDHDFYLTWGLPLLNPLSPRQFLILPDKDLFFRFNVDWQMGDYRQHSLIDYHRQRRSDLITTYNFTVSQTLIDDPKIGEMILHGIINWTDARSNVGTRYGTEPFTYDKVVYGVQLEWTW